VNHLDLGTEPADALGKLDAGAGIPGRDDVGSDLPISRILASRTSIDIS
jgi:hypothetical protein